MEEYMKIGVKKIIFLVFLFSLSVISYADEDTFSEVNRLLQDGLNENFDLIQGKADLLSSSEKIFLFDKFDKSAGLPVTLNLLVGFGVGSYIQGDKMGGTIQVISESLGVVGIILGMLSTGPSSQTENAYEEDSVLMVAAGVGIIFYVGAKIFGGVRPFVFKSRYNGKLKDALQYHSVSYNIVPSFDYNGNGKIAATLSLKF
jgi:hypothetical protein